MQSQSAREPLELWIESRIRAGGPVSFAQFMGWALYHPEYGYYTRGPNIGPRGDFTTSPEASPGFGRLMARHLIETDRLLGHPNPFSAVECGPGRGTLASDLLDTLKADEPDLYGRLHYLLIDVSPALTAAQQEKLLPRHGRVARWRADVKAIPAGLQGVVIANELVDAFPVCVLENRAGTILEHFVTISKEGGLALTYLPPSDTRLSSFLEKQQIRLQPGQRTEINLAAGEWLTDVAGVLARGIVTIIDYGDAAPERYSPARRQGTLLGYFGGSVTDNVLAHPGRQDLTALVDFTALQDAANRAGFTTLGMTRQAHFLLGLGLGTSHTAESVAGSTEEALAYRRGLQALISMEGLGRFHVLHLGKNVDSEKAAQLSALKYLHF